MLEDTCFYSSVPAEAVTIIAIPNSASSQLCCVTNRKVKSLKQCFYRNNAQYRKLY